MGRTFKKSSLGKEELARMNALSTMGRSLRIEVGSQQTICAKRSDSIQHFWQDHTFTVG